MWNSGFNILWEIVNVYAGQEISNYSQMDVRPSENISNSHGIENPSAGNIRTFTSRHCQFHRISKHWKPKNYDFYRVSIAIIMLFMIPTHWASCAASLVSRPTSVFPSVFLSISISVSLLLVETIEMLAVTVTLKPACIPLIFFSLFNFYLISTPVTFHREWKHFEISLHTSLFFHHICTHEPLPQKKLLCELFCENNHPPTPGFLWDLGTREVKFGSKKTIFRVVWGGRFENQPPIFGKVSSALQVGILTSYLLYLYNVLIVYIYTYFDHWL